MAYYFSSALNTTHRKTVIEEAVKQLSSIQFDTIAVRGYSGLSVGAIVAYLLNKSLYIVRKGTANTDSHNGDRSSVSEDINTHGRYIILDDFINSGKTVNAIFTEVSKVYPQLKFVGFYLYREDWKQSLCGEWLNSFKDSHRLNRNRVWNEDSTDIVYTNWGD